MEAKQMHMEKSAVVKAACVKWTDNACLSSVLTVGEAGLYLKTVNKDRQIWSLQTASTVFCLLVNTCLHLFGRMLQH